MVCLGQSKELVLKPNGLFGAYKRAAEHDNFVDEDFFDEDEIEEFLEELLEEHEKALEDDEYDMQKREDFWAARGKKDDANFWATRG